MGFRFDRYDEGLFIKQQFQAHLALLNNHLFTMLYLASHLINQNNLMATILMNKVQRVAQEFYKIQQKYQVFEANHSQYLGEVRPRAELPAEPVRQAAPLRPINLVLPQVRRVVEPVRLPQRHANPLSRIPLSPKANDLLKKRKVYDFVNRKAVPIDNEQKYLLVSFNQGATYQLVSKDNVYAMIEDRTVDINVRRALRSAYNENRFVRGRQLSEFAVEQAPAQFRSVNDFKLNDFAENDRVHIKNGTFDDLLNNPGEASPIEDHEKYYLVPKNEQGQYDVHSKDFIDRMLEGKPTFAHPLSRFEVSKQNLIAVTGAELKAMGQNLQREAERGYSSEAPARTPNLRK